MRPILCLVMACLMLPSCSSPKPRPRPAQPVASVPAGPQEDVWVVMDENEFDRRLNAALNPLQAKLKLSSAQSAAIATAKSTRESRMKAMVQTKGHTMRAMIDEERQAREARARGESETLQAKRRADQQKYVREYVQLRDMDRTLRRAISDTLTDEQRVAWHAEAIRPELQNYLKGKTLSPDQQARYEPALKGVAKAVIAKPLAEQRFTLLLGAAQTAGRYVINPADPALNEPAQ